MNGNIPTKSAPVQGWDTFWRGTGEAGAYSSGGADHPAIKAFWSHFFGLVRDAGEAATMIDLASGNGAVVESALALSGDSPWKITCLDISEAAIVNIESRFEGVRGMVADARSMPLESGTFDIVTSQFGVEYAGLEAFDEALRLLAPGGRLAMLIHNRDGSIHRECAVNLEAVSRLDDSGFIELSAQMLRAGFEAVRGADRAPYEAAATRLAGAIAPVEAILRQYGLAVADNTIAKLYDDVARIHENIQRYDAAEVLAWLERLRAEVDAYAERMSSMCQCALDRAGFEQVCAALERREIIADQAGPLLVPGSDLPLAWAILAART